MTQNLNPLSNLLLGKGKVYLDILSDDGQSTGEFDLGNCTLLTTTVTRETTEKKSNMTAGAPTLANITKSVSVALKITGDYFNAETKKLLAYGDTVELTQAAETITDRVITTAFQPGRRYRLGAFGVDPATLVLKVGAATIASCIFDAKTQTVYVPTGTAGGTLTASFSTLATTKTVLAGGTRRQITALVRYVADNAVGTNDHVVFHKVDLTPDGEVGYITDDLGAWSLAGAVLDDSANHPDTPYYSVESAE